MIKIINRAPCHCFPSPISFPLLLGRTAWQSFDSNPRVSLFSPITTLVVSGVYSFEIPMVETIFSSVLPFLPVLSPYSFIDVSISNAPLSPAAFLSRCENLSRAASQESLDKQPSKPVMTWSLLGNYDSVPFHRSFLFVFVFILLFFSY